MPSYPPPCKPGTRVRFFQRHRGLTADTAGEAVFTEHRVSVSTDNWEVVDDDGRRWYLIPEFGDTMEPVDADR